jgi:hypothetical protein
VHAANRPEGATEEEVAAWAGEQWERFEALSRTVSNYFNLVFDRDKATAALATQEGDDDDPRILRWSSKGELKSSAKAEAASPRSEDDARARVQGVIDDVHGGSWSLDADGMAGQIRSDFRTIALVMVRGKPNENARETRNPLLGMMDLSREVVEAMCGVGGLYWGGCEFGNNSGDVMHFDLGELVAIKDMK